MAFSSIVSELDEEIARTSCHISKNLLQARRNTVASPLCRLPFDVLSPILYDVFLREQQALGLRSFRCLPEARYGWLQFINVCTYVRRVAVESPQLWSFISLNHRSDEW
jgi:hypothetical protein